MPVYGEGVRTKLSCVYFLMHKDKLVYIGSTGKLSMRLSAHRNWNRKYDDYMFVPFKVSLAALRKAELYFIQFFEPVGNKNYKAKSGLDGSVIKYCVCKFELKRLPDVERPVPASPECVAKKYFRSR